MERMTFFENNPEKRELREEVIYALKEKGREHSRTQELLNELLSVLEEQAEKAENYELGQAKLNFDLAYVYFEAGFEEDAYDCYDQALEQVEHAQIEAARKEALCEEILQEMKNRGLLREGRRPQRWAQDRNGVNFFNEKTIH